MNLISVYNAPLSAQVLYQLLRERDETININHKALPKWSEHLDYIASKPYQGWYLIEDYLPAAVHVGACYLTQSDEIGIFILKEYQGRSYGPEAVRLLMARHGRRNYVANINPQNVRSIAMFKALGFRQESDTRYVKRIMNIAGREIGKHQPPYMVAELSGNHGGDLSKMLEMIKAAKWAGADAAKFQLYKPEDLASPGSKYWDIYQKCAVPVDWLMPMYRQAVRDRISLFASVFAPWAIGALEAHGCPAYKIASPEAKNAELVKLCRDTGKPVIVSTGMLDKRDWNIDADVILHCVAQYPAKIENANLKAIQFWANTSGAAGLSDHTPGITASIAATALGAVMIEKHFCLDASNCIDGEFSLEPHQFKQMVEACRQTWSALGDGIPRVTCAPRQKEAA